MSKRASPRKLPFDISAVYGPNRVLRSESDLTRGEAGGKTSSDVGEALGAALGKVAPDGIELTIDPSTVGVRVLTDFIFVKNGQYVDLKWRACTEEFWDGVVVYGFTMPVGTREDRWYVWSLWWTLEWPSWDMELVRIDNIIGMSKECNVHFRNGNVWALWLETKEHGWALAEPDKLIEHRWPDVLASWADTNGNTNEVLAITRIGHFMAPPGWWCGPNGAVAGERAWQSLMTKFIKYAKTQGEEAEPEVRDMLNEIERQQSEPSDKPKGKRKATKPRRGREDKRSAGGSTRVPATAVVASSAKPPAQFASPSGLGPAPGQTSTTSPSKTRKRGADEAEGSEDHGGSTDGEGESDEEHRGEGTESGPEEPPPAKRSRMSLKDLAPQPSSSDAAATSEKIAAKSRMLREGEPRYSPGPSTQQANVLPALETGRSAGAQASSAPASAVADGGVPRQEEVSSQASQLAGAVQVISIEDSTTSKDGTGRLDGPEVGVGEAVEVLESSSVTIALPTVVPDASIASGAEPEATSQQVAGDAHQEPSLPVPTSAPTGDMRASNEPPRLAASAPPPIPTPSTPIAVSADGTVVSTAAASSAPRPPSPVTTPALEDQNNANRPLDGVAARTSAGGAAPGIE
ncbi:hypothetical protein FRC09_000711 [Ceratobasidium sp. 395]|nr:hypothetical protein FRC09_000711 [Ceratobasidium sp. 395]